MERVNEIANFAIERYEVWGIAIISLTLLLFIVQLCYWIGGFSRIAKYRDKKRVEILHETPKVSVIIPLFAEDYQFLDERLPLFMVQEGVDFEMVIVYVGNNKDFYEDIQRLQQALPNITATKIQANPRFPISVKAALNVGIKAAHCEHLIFTTTDCYPRSDKWLALMANGFRRGDIVTGYTALESEKGFGRYFMRTMQLMESASWMKAAIKGSPYRGVCTNIGWTKSLYYKSNGFSHLNMNIGNDDLFIQHLIKNYAPQVSLILSPRATLNQLCWGDMGWWSSEYRYFRSSFSLYPRKAKMSERGERRSRILFMVCAILSIALLPLEIKGAALLLIIIRLGVVLMVVKDIANRVGEAGVASKYILFDMLSPLYISVMDISLKLRREPRAWR